MAPQDTCVVETGRPASDAAPTSAAVTALAAKPWPCESGAMRSLMVTATRRAASSPPSVIATVMTSTASAPPMPDHAAATARAAIFGASFSPRAKPTSPALRKCERSTKRCASHTAIRPR